MMPDTIFSKPSDRLLVLGFDMDGCLADDLLYPGLLRNHRFSINAMQRILMLADASAFDEIVICPATNRKDKYSDEENAQLFHTPLTEEALRTVFRVLSSLLQDSGIRLILDTRLHVDQLFSNAESGASCDYIEQATNMMASCDVALDLVDHHPRLYSKRSSESNDKLDIVMTLAHQYADNHDNKTVTLVLIDDRFFTDTDEEVKSLHSMMQFFTRYSHYLPSNLTLMAVRMDPYVIKDELDERCASLQLMRSFMKDCTITLGETECSDIWSQVVSYAAEYDFSLEGFSFESFVSIILSSDLDDRAEIDMDESLLTRLECLLFECLVAKNPFRDQAFNDVLLDARLSYLDSLSNEAYQSFMVDMIENTCTCQGEFSEFISVTSEAFWTTCLVPAALKYRRFLKHPELEDNLVVAATSSGSLVSR